MQEEFKTLFESLPSVPLLRRYQWDGVRFLVGCDGALLSDEMGLGKTVQAITALRLLLHTPSVNRALVVVPASLRQNWLDEFSKWANELVVRPLRGSQNNRLFTYKLPLPVLLCSYEQLRIDAIRFKSRDYFDIVILDEAQRIKNPGSNSALACRLLSRGRIWALTGTPVENRLSDLKSIFNILAPGLLESCSTRRQIHDRIRPRFLRRRKSSVLSELPPIIVQDVPLILDGCQRIAYDEAWARRRSRIQESSSSMLALITELKLLCNHHLESGESVKLNFLQHVLESLSSSDEKVLVFSQYVKTLRWVAERMESVPIDLLHGGMSTEARANSIRRFQNLRGPRALFVSYGAGGVGLNLQEASTVVLFDRWWNPAVENQAIQRAHRFGRELPLHVLRFIVRDTIEEQIVAILDEKQQLFKEYVDDAPVADLAESRHVLHRILGLSRR